MFHYCFMDESVHDKSKPSLPPPKQELLHMSTRFIDSTKVSELKKTTSNTLLALPGNAAQRTILCVADRANSPIQKSHN